MIQRATKLLDGAAPSSVRLSVLCQHALSLLVNGRTSAALQMGLQAEALSLELGLSDQRALALCAVGNSELMLGLPGALSHLELAARVAESVNSVETPYMYADLGEAHITLGDLGTGMRCHEVARQGATRFALSHLLRHLKIARALHAYWGGDWDSALDQSEEALAEIATGTPHGAEDLCWQVRSLVSLGRGDIHGAIRSAERAVQVSATFNRADQVLPTLALYARVLLAAGRHTEADRVATKVFAFAPGNLPATSPDWSGPLALVLNTLGRGEELLASSPGSIGRRHGCSRPGRSRSASSTRRFLSTPE